MHQANAAFDQQVSTSMCPLGRMNDPPYVIRDDVIAHHK
jgi:hypothetical protein